MLTALIAALYLMTTPSLNIPGAPQPTTTTQSQQKDQLVEGVDFPSVEQKTIMFGAAAAIGERLLPLLVPLKEGFKYGLSSVNFSQNTKGALCVAVYNVLKGKDVVGSGVVNLLFVFQGGHWAPMHDVFQAL